ncbi:MAG TPA: glutathione S-transferase family protein [Byssovorax sp.]|jgi:glutathione S-transferase
MTSIVIHHAPQTRAAIVLWTLEELGVPYESKKVDFKSGEHKSEGYAKINPNKRVPAMIVDGRPMFESTAMVIFLAEKFGADKKLWPTDDAGRAEAMGWTVWGTAQLGHDIHGLMMASSERVPKELHHEPMAKLCRGAVETDLKVLDARLAEHPYVMGETFTLADVLPAMACFFAGMGGVDLAAYKHVSAWVGKLQAREALQRAQAM